MAGGPRLHLDGEHVAVGEGQDAAADLGALGGQEEAAGGALGAEINLQQRHLHLPLDHPLPQLRRLLPPRALPDLLQIRSKISAGAAFGNQPPD